MDIPASFLLTSLIIEATPGPNMAYLAILSLGNGRRAGYAATAGTALGLLIVGLIVAMGIGALIENSPAAYAALRWGGVFYMLWLAWDGWRDPAGNDHGDPHETARTITFFRRGLIVNLLNPKAAVFYIAVMPGFVTNTAPPTPQIIALTLVYVAVATFVHGAIVTLAGSARQFLQSPQRSRIVRRALSLALAAVALWFAWETGHHRPE